MKLRTMFMTSQIFEIAGGATSSIFPQVEELIQGNSDYVRALGYVAAKKKMDRYQSIMDFLFCELHPEWQHACRRFYANEGKPLREHLDRDDWTKANGRLVAALKVALQCLNENRRISWGWYRTEVEEAFFAAA